MRRFTSPAFRYWIAVSGLLLATASGASDGRFEINQLCVAAGCFGGDTPGFPVQIENSGSYVLTSNIVVPEGGSGIQVSVEDVRIDLAGHTIRGVVTCSGDNPDCAPVTGGFGISGGTSENLAIVNGAVAGFGSSCISDAGTGFHLKDVFVSSCRGPGINSTAGGIVESVTVFDNGQEGIFADRDILVRDSVFRNNGREGIRLGVCRGNLLDDNGDAGGTAEEACNDEDGSNLCNLAVCP